MYLKIPALCLGELYCARMSLWKVLIERGLRENIALVNRKLAEEII